MVDSEIVDIARELLGASPRKFLVTGATGFVGRKVAQVLTRSGQQVTATGRNRYLAPPGIEFIQADIRNGKDVAGLCEAQDIVIHCAANTSPSGTYQTLADVNVTGTQNVINGCIEHSVKRLIHVSSTSVLFGFRDRFNISDRDAPPRRFSCHYARTKFEAEQAVRRASRNGLNAIIVRARAVFGRGDQSLMPRLLRAYDQGRLRQVGGGSNAVDLTYLDNLVYGLLLAIDRGESGSVCTVTGEQPVLVWETIRQILNETGRTRPLRRVPYPLAYAAGFVSESLHRLFRKPGEPAWTRYAAGLLAKNQTFSPESARVILGYRPIVSMKEGICRTIDSLNRMESGHSPSRVRVRLFTTGFTEVSFPLVERGGNRERVPIHASFALIEHPVHGITLFDTGYSPRFHEATKHWPYRLQARLTPVKTSAAASCLGQLKTAGVDPGDVKRIVLSHLHADHICGLADFPDADIIASRSAWEAVAGKSSWAAVKRGFLPALLPSDIHQRLYLLPEFADPGIGPFRHCHDLFHDGSIRLLKIPGHATGQIGLLAQTGTEQREFLVADAAWTTRTITEDLKPTLAFRMIADSARQARETIRKLNEFHQQFPKTRIIPTHCRTIAEQEGFDEQLQELLKMPPL